MFRKRSAKASKTASRKPRERVIVDGRIIDVAELRREAKKAGTRFWVLLVVASVIASTIVPYASMAAIAPANTTVFKGEVIPGYSMGGMEIAAYGVDINSWGQSTKQSESNPAIVQSQYGYWTKKRAENAAANLVASQRADKGKEGTALEGYTTAERELSGEDKARGWVGITRDDGKGNGLSDFSSEANGRSDANRKRYNESVAPYRTQADWKYWDTRSVGGSSASITATVYPDFVIFGWDAKEKTARTLTNPDDIQNLTNGEGVPGVIAGTTSVPHYVPLSTLYEAFGLGDKVMDGAAMNSMDTLFQAIMDDAREHDGKSPKLNAIVENKKNDPKNDLLLGTHYDNLNGANAKSESGSDAWNPYPYSMVFRAQDERGTVVSSIYNNTEAYVYFSPRSAYNLYSELRSEYDMLVNASSAQVAEAQPQAAFQLGYYLAGMSILEAYLSEALPQDMTRGYVGPAEGNPIASAAAGALTDASKLDTRGGKKGSTPDLFAGMFGSVDSMMTTEGLKNDSAVGFRAVPYSQLMYDFADAAMVKHGAKGEGTWLGATSAIMNTLSTYGYGVHDTGQNVPTAKSSAGQGPNRGMTCRQQMARVTSFGPYTRSGDSLKVSITKDKDDPMLHPSVSNAANTGMYVPVYYPIQQHEMPSDSELPYRFQVLSLIPYDTLAYELGKHGFDKDVTLSYDNKAVDKLEPTKNYYSKVASLARQLDDLNDGTMQDLGGFEKGKSITLNPQTSDTAMVGQQSTSAYAEGKTVTDRVDNALMAFNSGLMNADNVHDLVDVVRAIPGVKYETFVRYYNPIKSSGGANDIYLTRVTPAQTTYMPSILTAGYECAGGTTNNQSIANPAKSDYDYFSLPSFAPCFAAKTAEDTYYGALTYELRPFYTRGFLGSIAADTNVPDLEAFEETKDTEEAEVTDAIAGMKTKILTIYILAKRLAFAEAYGKLDSAAKGKDGRVTAGGLYYADTSMSSVFAAGDGVGDDAVRSALKPKDAGSYAVPSNDDGSKGFSKLKKDEKLPDSATTHGDGDNKIDTEDVGGVRYGESEDGSQVKVDGDTYQVKRDADGNITDVVGASKEDAQKVKDAQKKQQEKRAAEAAAAAGGGGGTAGGGNDGDEYFDDEGDVSGSPAVATTTMPTGDNGTGRTPPPNAPLAGSNLGTYTHPGTYHGRGNGDGFGGWSGDRIGQSARGGGGGFSSGGGNGFGGADADVKINNYSHAGGAFIALNWCVQLLRWVFESADMAQHSILCPTIAYAAPSSEAEGVYTNDKLEDKGYKKGSASDWSALKGKVNIQTAITFHVASGTEVPASGEFDYVMQKFGQKHIMPDSTLSKQAVWCKTGDGLAFVTDVQTILSALYNDSYVHHMSPEGGDSYYWDAAKEIAEYGVDVDTTQMAKEDEKSEYNTVAMRYSDAKNDDRAQRNLDEYCEQAFKELAEMVKSLRMLNDKLPKQMQNVLAWADEQLPSDSELNYQTDPSDNKLYIDLGVRNDDDNNGATIHNLNEAQRFGFLLYDNDGDYAIANSNGTAESATATDTSDRQARTVRGIPETTATASVHLGGYTISATVGRISRLVPASASTSTVPYSGIYTGSLSQGADRCAQIQAHTIDHQSIAAGLSGDLRSRGSSTIQVAMANENSDMETQQYVQTQATIVTEMQQAIVPTSMATMEIAMDGVMPSGSSSVKGIEDAHAGSRFLDAVNPLAGDSTAEHALARASTFDQATMSRQSAVSQKYSTQTQRMVNRSGMATASADEVELMGVKRNMGWAESALKDGWLSDMYATIQSLALVLVLIFLMVIAFQNFVGYTSGNEKGYIDAQTKLKTVLPRALIAVAMIGLPPIGGGVGFQGGCFVLLQVISTLVDQMLSVFTDGTDMFNGMMAEIWKSFQVNFDITKIVEMLLTILLNLLATTLFFVGSLFVALLCLVTDVVLFLFWMIGPFIWAFYVWPYDEEMARRVSGKRGMRGLLAKITDHLSIKSFTDGRVARDAPSGWVMGYISTLSTIVLWNLLFWGFAFVLWVVNGKKISEAAQQSGIAARAGAAENLNLAQNASDVDVYGTIQNGGSFTFITGLSEGMKNLLLSILFLVCVYVMFRILKNSLGGALKFMYGAVGFAGKVALTAATGGLASAAKGANLAKATQGLANNPVGKAINFGARGIDGIAHGVGKGIDFAHSSSGRQIGQSFNRMIDKATADVSERDNMPGAFDNLLTLDTRLDENGNKQTVVNMSPMLEVATAPAKFIAHKTSQLGHNLMGRLRGGQEEEPQPIEAQTSGTQANANPLGASTSAGVEEPTGTAGALESPAMQGGEAAGASGTASQTPIVTPQEAPMAPVDATAGTPVLTAGQPAAPVEQPASAPSQSPDEAEQQACVSIAESVQPELGAEVAAEAEAHGHTSPEESWKNGERGQAEAHSFIHEPKALEQDETEGDDATAGEAAAEPEQQPDGSDADGDGSGGAPRPELSTSSAPGEGGGDK